MGSHNRSSQRTPLGLCSCAPFSNRRASNGNNIARVPNSYHGRASSTRIDGIRGDSTNQWNANVSQNFASCQPQTGCVPPAPTSAAFASKNLACVNAQNRPQMGGPNTDPFSTNFGRITSQTAATNRWMEAQARITF